MFSSRTLIAALVALALAAFVVEAKVVSFGNNYYYNLGNGNSTDMNEPVEATELSGIQVTSLATGKYHVLVVSDDKKVWSYGYNYYGQLGFGNTSCTDDGTSHSYCIHAGLVKTTGTALEDKTVKAVAAGESFSLALTEDGQVVAFGYNNRGQLGDGSETERDAPVAVTTPETISAIAAGSEFSLALSSTGVVYSWGYGWYGQLGNGSSTSHNAPVNVDTTLMNGTITAIAAGNSHSVALDSDGQVWAWGYNGYGSLGDGTTTERDSPVAMNLTNVSGKVTAIAAGYDHTLLLTESGKVYACGRNDNGQLGDGTVVSSTIPIEVTFASKFKAISAGYSHSLALTEDGKAYAWGINTYGGLGDGTSVTKKVPTAVLATHGPLSGANVLSVSANYYYSVLLVEGGNVPDSAVTSASASFVVMLIAVFAALALLL